MCEIFGGGGGGGLAPRVHVMLLAADDLLLLRAVMLLGVDVFWLDDVLALPLLFGALGRGFRTTLELQ
jgi:hypothetical protein